MKVSRFTKVVQLISLALVFCVANVYVIGAPLKTNTDPRTDKSNATQPAAEKDAATTSEAQPAGPQAASERMPLTAGTRTVLTRIFSKKDVQSRVAAGSSSFVNVKASAGNMFKAPRKALAQSDDDSDDNDNNDRRNMWIAVGVIAAVLTVAIIALRADRSREGVQ
ncbi:MAG TPA: hypothetical protein VJ715_12090 [Pyrinomonadaceae bacterium]|nr:hypothetical protein [Pyrinomonadaceae bacterium]